VYWPDAGTRLATVVHDGGRLRHGDEITGPALVELSHTTIAVPRAATLTADHGHFRLLLPADDTTVKGAAR
jgi:N-methylhydantoinase A/oxoprolinase/acetone carboxylase beta subunit